jgi:hypothetical protein
MFYIQRSLLSDNMNIYGHIKLFNACVQFHLPYLGLYNVQYFAQILYLVGGVRIINRNNVFHSFPDREITCPPCFFDSPWYSWAITELALNNNHSLTSAKHTITPEKTSSCL